MLDEVLMLRGWGRVVSLEKMESSNQKTVYGCIFRNCIICHDLRAQEPICDVIRGIFAGWLESFMEKKALSSVETECQATGKKFCVFQISFAE